MKTEKIEFLAPGYVKHHRKTSMRICNDDRWDEDANCRTELVESFDSTSSNSLLNNTNHSCGSCSVTSRSTVDSAPIRPKRRTSVKQRVIPFSRSSSRRSIVLDNSWHGDHLYNWNDLESSQVLNLSSPHGNCRDQKKSSRENEKLEEPNFDSSFTIKQHEGDILGESTLTFDGCYDEINSSDKSLIEDSNIEGNHNLVESDDIFHLSYFSFF
jgi:hypothetical protein